MDFKIAVVGLGYVGLPTALEFASIGLNVVGIDTDQSKIALLNEGKSPYKDEYIKKLFDQIYLTDKFEATNYYSEIRNCQFVLITLPTPVDSDKTPDLSYIISAAESIKDNLIKGHIIILESTVYPGVTEQVLLPILKMSHLKYEIDFNISYCPERYNPGDPNHSIKDTIRVIGANNDITRNKVNKLYSLIQQTFIASDIITAETSKVIENIQRDVNIALINEIAIICEKLSINVYDVLNAASTKWNFVNFRPGPGVGGHCLPHDPYYFANKAISIGYTPNLILAGRAINDSMPNHVYKMILKSVKDIPIDHSQFHITIIGATYKANIDDIRSSPVEKLISIINQMTKNIQIIEPNYNFDRIFGVPNHSKLSNNIIQKSHILIFVVKHDLFSYITEDYILSNYHENLIIIDTIKFFPNKTAFVNKIHYSLLGDGSAN